MINGTTSVSNKVVRQAAVQPYTADFVNECFDIIGIVQRERHPMTVIEIAEALDIAVTPRLVAIVRGLVVSGYLECHKETNEIATFTLRKGKVSEPYLPLPYYCLS